MRQKALATLAIAVAVALVAAGCGGGDDQSPAAAPAAPAATAQATTEAGEGGGSTLPLGEEAVVEHTQIGGGGDAPSTLFLVPEGSEPSKVSFLPYDLESETEFVHWDVQ